MCLLLSKSGVQLPGQICPSAAFIWLPSDRGYKGTISLSKTTSVTLCLIPFLCLSLIPALLYIRTVHTALSKDNPRSRWLQTSNAGWHRIPWSGCGSLGSLSAGLCLLWMGHEFIWLSDGLSITSLGLEGLQWPCLFV